VVECDRSNVLVRHHLKCHNNHVFSTHTDESKAFICICMIVCPYNRTKTAETTITNLSQGQSIMSPPYPFNIRSKGQRSRSQGHKVQKHISDDGVAGVSLRSIEWPASSRILLHLNWYRFPLSGHNYLLNDYDNITFTFVITKQSKKLERLQHGEWTKEIRDQNAAN